MKTNGRKGRSELERQPAATFLPSDRFSVVIMSSLLAELLTACIIDLDNRDIPP